MSNDLIRLDTDHEALIMRLRDELMDWLQNNVPNSNKYSKRNLSLNVLTAGVVTIACQCVSDDNEEWFIKCFAASLRENFQENRRKL